jgi:UDP-glucuronate 4-epimerase
VRVIVTGGAGFIGSHVCERLVAAGADVLIIDSFDPFYDPAEKERNIASLLASPRVRLARADICDIPALHAAVGDDHVDAVIHLAARAGVRPSLENPASYLRTNVEGTLNLLELCRAKKIRSFVMGSSSSVYGDATPVPFVETEPAANPISPYAASKRSGELLCHVYAHLYAMTVACVRLFTVYGPRQRPDLAIHKFARLMHAGQPIPYFGDGQTERDYTYVADIVQGIEGALHWTMRAPPGAFEIANLGESETTSLDELVRLIAAELDVVPVLHRLPLQPGDVMRTCASIEKARELFGYDPSTSMREGIHHFAEWFRERNSVVSGTEEKEYAARGLSLAD